MLLKNKIEIDNITVSPSQPVFIIAEAGVNHNGDIQLAKKLIDVAKEAGADAVKFQTFKTELLNTRNAPKSQYHIDTTGEGSWFDLLKTQELDKEAHKTLIDYCNKKEILFLSTPYDEPSADLLDELNVAAYKVASTDSNNIPFLKYLVKKNRPILLSTGMCSFEEINESVKAIVQTNFDQLMLFHCTANYPIVIEDVNLLVMSQLKEKFKVLVGYSDHSTNLTTGALAVALGAVSYEKHFTLDKDLPGPDHRASADPEELRTIIRNIRDAEIMLGSPDKKLLESEVENQKKLRKSIVAKCDIQQGDIINSDLISIKRPGFGLAPKHYDFILGKTANKAIIQEDFIRLEDVD